MPTLDFKGKQFVYAHHLTVPFRQLNVDAKKSLPEKGGKPSLDGNLIIHGDNLHALKALLPKYAGKIKCIYIDPPYNTGNEGWCYNDKVNSPLIKEWLKDSANPVDKEDLERHDKWLCMMWPRLQLLKELLAEDGIILVSIDDIEYANLKCALDETFGEAGFFSTFVWRRRIGSSMASSWVSLDHEYVIGYSKSSDDVFVMGDERDMTKYNISDGTGRFYASMPLTVGMTKEMRPNQWYEIKNPKTGKGYWPAQGRVWGFYPPTMEQKIKDGLIIWPEDFPDKNLTTVRLKSYPEDAKRDRKPVSSFILEKNRQDGEEDTHFLAVGKTEEGTRILKELFGENVFPYPKPLSLVASLIHQFTREDDIVLDSFAGSGTTAHAVLALNKEDGGNRKFIMVECEKYADDITAERVRRVIKGVPSAKDVSLKEGLGGSFTFCNLGDEINIENLLKGDKLPSFEELSRYAFYTATGQTLDKVKQGADYFVGETESYRVHVIYKPELDFLRSGESALNMPLAESISQAKGKKTTLVFATHKFMGQKELSSMGITFCQLPYQLYRIMGD